MLFKKIPRLFTLWCSWNKPNTTTNQS